MRDEVASGSELGKQLAQFINNGIITPSELAMQVINKNIMSGQYDRIVIDGFPRTIE